MKRTFAMIFSALLLASMASCGGNESLSVPDLPVPDNNYDSEVAESTREPETPAPTDAETEIETEKDASETNETNNNDKTETTNEKATEKKNESQAEPVKEHVSPTENVFSALGIQQTINQTIERTEGSNTIKLPLADFIREGDRVTSFTFVIYSSDGSNIGEFKGGCGVSVNSDCTAATDEGWYQSDDFTSPTQGTYGEITWNVPSNVSDYISESGDVLFGYWWGNAGSIRVESVICNINRSCDVPCDGTASQNVGKSVNYNDADNTVRVPLDFLPDNAVPQAVTYNISSNGGFRKFTGAFGYDSSLGYYQSEDVAVFTDSSSVSLTWIVDAQAKNLAAKDGELVLGYWWSEQPSAVLDSVSVKYSVGGSVQNVSEKPKDNSADKAETKPSTGFRSSAEIVKDIKIGWNLGNSLESYGTEKTGLSSETGWGNPKATEALIKTVKDAGFNAIRIPVTWGEHMDGDTIQSEWMDRVQEVVDYAYNNDMYVILNMHHDDYIWFNPTEAEYPGDSAKLKKIWEQISERFKDYGDRLIFEGMNEARTIGSANEWMGGTAEERAVVNRYEQDFVDTVRASGGKNADRSLIVTAYGACAEEVSMNDLIVPKDDHVIVSLHYYAPWKFSSGQSTNFGDSEKSELDKKFDSMKSRFIDKGIPTIIDEFGCVGVADDSVRSDYYRYYISAAKSRGIKCFVWDNNISRGTDGYGIINRNSLEWNQTLLNGVIEGSNS